MALVANHWWLGVGPGNFQIFYPEYRLITASETPADPHNFLLETAATIGLPGLIGLIAMGIGIARRPVLAILSGAVNQTSQNVTSESRERPRVLALVSLVIASLLVWTIPGLVGPYPPMAPYVVGIPLALGVTWFLPIVLSERLAWLAASVAICVATAIHLTGSGGWLSPGVTHVAIATLMVVGRELVPTTLLPQSSLSSDRASIQRRWIPRFVILGLWGAALVSFLNWVWYPTQAIDRWEQIITMPQPSAATAIESAEEAAAADPYSPLPTAYLVEIRFTQLLEAADREKTTERASASYTVAMKAYTAARQAWLNRDQANWLTWQSLGQQAMLLRSLRSNSDLLPTADFLESARRNPNEISTQMQLALAAHLERNATLCIAALDRTEQIEAITPHMDRQLRGQTLYWPALQDGQAESPEMFACRQKAIVGSLGQNRVKAKPVYEFLRSQYKMP
jgi:hypothetical protein